MANKKMSVHVEFEKDVTEFIPYDSAYSPCKTAASSESIDNKRVFFDEIALLKRHLINRDGSVKERKMGAALKAKNLEPVPISVEELKKRGIKLENGKVIHSLPTPNNSTVSSVSSCSSIKNTSSNTRSSISRTSTVQSRISMFEAAVSEETYKVCLPCENATLKISKLKKGERIELTIKDKGVCAVEISDKQSTLISYKD